MRYGSCASDINSCKADPGRHPVYGWILRARTHRAEDKIRLLYYGHNGKRAVYNSIECCDYTRVPVRAARWRFA
eukprot:6197078-Pleurochrysis_carterae.AAC.2